MYLALENIVKTFVTRGGVGEVTAVDGVSLEINEGELVTLLGPSGCGKTTTLRLIAGFEFPNRGNIFLDGEVINELPPHSRDMSMVFQSYAVFPHLNVYENVAYGLKVQRLSKDEIQNRVDRALQLVELTGLDQRAPNQLSGGQQQRVALARALIMEPKVLLMDEPLSNLDAKLRVQMRTEIRRIQQQLGITSVYVTHDQIEAMTLSDRIVVMNEGIIEQIGSPTEVYRHPSTRFVADFIGRANFVPGMVQQVSDGSAVVSAFGQPIKLADVRTDINDGDKVTLVVRPEMIQIVPHENAVKATVHRVSYLGDMIEYDVQVDDTTIIVVETDPTRMVLHPVGADVGLEFREDCIHILPPGQ
ncbi:MAG: ABC transporter ATP-binding protein [Chloroflexota bacterium]